jgi:hypothetical protein
LPALRVSGQRRRRTRVARQGRVFGGQRLQISWLAPGPRWSRIPRWLHPPAIRPPRRGTERLPIRCRVQQLQIHDTIELPSHSSTSFACDPQVFVQQPPTTLAPSSSRTSSDTSQASQEKAPSASPRAVRYGRVLGIVGGLVLSRSTPANPDACARWNPITPVPRARGSLLIRTPATCRYWFGGASSVPIAVARRAVRHDSARPLSPSSCPAPCLRRARKQGGLQRADRS